MIHELQDETKIDSYEKNSRFCKQFMILENGKYIKQVLNQCLYCVHLWIRQETSYQFKKIKFYELKNLLNLEIQIAIRIHIDCSYHCMDT